ncbi:MAG: DUF3108 domain-containing protein [Lautropia sp.]|nr:DUF3108 domain-containing protein [Lautropia sp.]
MTVSLRRRRITSSLLTGVLNRPLSRVFLSSAAVLGAASADAGASEAGASGGSGAGRVPSTASRPAVVRAPTPDGKTGASSPPAASASPPAAAASSQNPVLASLPALADAFALDFDVYYSRGSVQDMRVAHATYRFSRQGARYRLSTEARATGMLAVFYSGTLNQSSSGLLDAKGFHPQRYTEKRGKRPERTFVFETNPPAVRQGGQGPDYPYPEGTQDRLSIFFQLGLLARNGRPALQKGRQFALPLAGSHQVDEPFFQVVGTESQKTGAGTFDTLRISVRKPGDPQAPRFDVWLAPSLRMLPVRIRVFEKNESSIVDQLLSKLPDTI